MFQLLTCLRIWQIHIFSNLCRKDCNSLEDVKFIYGFLSFQMLACQSFLFQLLACLRIWQIHIFFYLFSTPFSRWLFIVSNVGLSNFLMFQLLTCLRIWQIHIFSNLRRKDCNSLGDVKFINTLHSFKCTFLRYIRSIYFQLPSPDVFLSLQMLACQTKMANSHFFFFLLFQLLACQKKLANSNPSLEVVGLSKKMANSHISNSCTFSFNY